MLYLANIPYDCSIMILRPFRITNNPPKASPPFNFPIQIPLKLMDLKYDKVKVISSKYNQIQRIRE